MKIKLTCTFYSEHRTFICNGHNKVYSMGTKKLAKTVHLYAIPLGLDNDPFPTVLESTDFSS